MPAVDPGSVSAAMRVSRFVGLMVVAVGAAIGLGACGSAEGDDTAAGGAPGADVTAPAPATSSSTDEQLEIKVTDGAGTTTTWTLTCDPAGGTHPDPAGACAALEQNLKALEPVAAGAVCTMIYGGDDKAGITGTWHGKPVDASFSLKSGCEIARWSALDPLLPAPGTQGRKGLTS